VENRDLPKALVLRTVRAMRYLLAITALSLLAFSGCDQERQNMAVVPDRQGHAASSGDQPANISQRGVAGPDEKYYTMEANDTLASIAKKFNVALDWLIKRNDIQDESKLTVGTQLIVPRQETATSRATPAAP
jgi:LysM repeat protein